MGSAAFRRCGLDLDDAFGRNSLGELLNVVRDLSVIGTPELVLQLVEEP